jgi:hypothetical protein
MNLTGRRIECAHGLGRPCSGLPGYRLDPVPAGAFHIRLVARYCVGDVAGERGNRAASIEAWNRRDWITMSSLYRSDAVIDWSRARGPLKGVYRGEREREAFVDQW